jgi:hypothetical protein
MLEIILYPAAHNIKIPQHYKPRFHILRLCKLPPSLCGCAVASLRQLTTIKVRRARSLLLPIDWRLIHHSFLHLDTVLNDLSLRLTA